MTTIKELANLDDILSIDDVFAVSLWDGRIERKPISEAIADLTGRSQCPIETLYALSQGATLTSNNYAYALEISAFGVVEGWA